MNLGVTRCCVMGIRLCNFNPQDLSLLMLEMQFASDKNFEHAHRCYDQALQMNSELVRIGIPSLYLLLQWSNST
jgi:hypothetical protein